MKNTFLKIVCAALVLSFSASVIAGEDYYRQFTYKKEVTNDGEENHIQYRFLQGQSEVVVSPLKKIMVSAEVYLLEGGQDFVTAYSEMLATRTSPTADWQYMPNPQQGMCPKVLKGTWSAPADQLVFSTPSISGDRAVFDSRNSAKLLFNDAILSPEVKGTELVMDFGYGNAPIEMNVGRGGFCPY
jgi:hypothetical protein